jgi:hypothetical protein
VKNWKTTASGSAAILVAAAHFLTGLVAGDTSGWGADFAAISAAIGLLFAKDANVTGGTVRQ